MIVEREREGKYIQFKIRINEIEKAISLKKAKYSTGFLPYQLNTYN